MGLLLIILDSYLLYRTRIYYIGLVFSISDSYLVKYIKHFQKMYRDVGMAVPKSTETRCRDCSVQGRHVIQRLHN